MENDAFSPSAPALTAPGSSGAAVLLGGAASTGVALVAVYLLDQVGWNVMGWYGDYVIPIGALLVGLVASSGYGIASWATGTKISGRLLFLVVAMLTGGYFLAKYLQFRMLFPSGAQLDDGTPLGFWSYFDLVTRAIAFEDETSHQPGTALGLWGYGIRALEVVGFVGGGVAVPWVLRSKPYCEACQRYKRTRSLGTLAASVPAKRVSKKKVEAFASYEASQAASLAQGQQAMTAILGAGSRGEGAAVRQLLSQHGSKVAGKLPARIEIALVHCKRCKQGELRGTMVTGQGRYIKRKLLSMQELAPAVVAELAPAS
ncbi:MAG TPA: hypothetical protein VMB50_11955 [Myxococcales bacterium]|nr:hypothetical protein [Myxococcales bacterium]